MTQMGQCEDQRLGAAYGRRFCRSGWPALALNSRLAFHLDSKQGARFCTRQKLPLSLTDFLATVGPSRCAIVQQHSRGPLCTRPFLASVHTVPLGPSKVFTGGLMGHRLTPKQCLPTSNLTSGNRPGPRAPHFSVPAADIGNRPRHSVTPSLTSQKKTFPAPRGSSGLLCIKNRRSQ